MTLNETIELMHTMAEKMPNRTRGDYPIGLYIETKQYGMYLDNYGINSAQMLFDHLKHYNLETI
jgi:hypothetical protein